MVQFFIHLRRVADRLANLILDVLSKPPAQSMNRNFDCSFGKV